MNEIVGHDRLDNQKGVARVSDGQVLCDNHEATAVAEPIAGQVIFDDHWKDASGGDRDVSAPFGHANVSGGSEATIPLTTKVDVSHTANIDGQIQDVSLKAVALTRPKHTASVAALVELQKQRVFCIKSQQRCDRSAEAFVARYLGYRPDLPEAQRAAVWKQAGALRKSIEKGAKADLTADVYAAPEASGDGHEAHDNPLRAAIAACTPIILNSASSRLAWDNHRAQVEKQMRRLAHSLPAYAWASTVKGFGDLGFAIIVGEADDLSRYATKERLWKRLGLAVIEGERQQRKSNKEAAVAHGYNPRRRAEIWTIADSLFRHQWHGAKDDATPGPSGPYGEIYQKRKDHTATREGWSPGRRDNDARRIMTKALIEDFWKAWRKDCET